MKILGGRAEAGRLASMDSVHPMIRIPSSTLTRSTTNTMEQFTIPLASFDVALLPEEAQDRKSPEFRAAVESFFRELEAYSIQESYAGFVPLMAWRTTSGLSRTLRASSIFPANARSV